MTGRSTSRRALVAGGIGNVVEWYDFAVYGAFATAFLARPVGALVFGRLGDRVGRRQVLVTVIVLMAAATAGIGLLPGHAAIGVLAPVLLVVLRTAQGLSVGGEAAGATAFVVEYAPEGRRGWYGSWLWSTLALGVAGGIGAAVVLARVFPRGVLEDRAWRLAFLVALPLGLVGLYLRVRLDDTPSFRAVERAGATARRPIADTLRVYPGRLLLGLAPVAAAALAGLLLVAVTAPAFGRLSDRVGRRPHLVAGTVGLVLAVLPAFLLIRRGAPVGLGVGYLLVALPLSCLVGERAVRGHGAVPGHPPGAADRQPARPRRLRGRGGRGGGVNGRGLQGDRVPAPGR